MKLSYEFTHKLRDIDNKADYCENKKDLILPKIIFQHNDKEILINEKSNNSTILEIAHNNGIDIEGACEGSLACSTCHIIVDKDWYNRLEEPSWDEEDMLDLATGLTVTSRLGCQIVLSEKLDGLKVSLPSNNNDIRLNKNKY